MLTNNKTVIIITHRLKTIENVDQIVLIEASEVEDIGKHEDLIIGPKKYRNLVEKASWRKYLNTSI